MPAKKYPCQWCPSAFERETLVAEHELVCRPYFFYKCKICHQLLREKCPIHFRLHLKNHCSVDEIDKRNFDLVEEIPKTWKCQVNKICDYSTQDKKEWEEHQKNCHIGCALCGEDYFNKRQTMSKFSNYKN